MQPSHVILSPEAAHARQTGTPLVALETTVITHGLPYPANLALAQDMEAEVRLHHAIPATIGIIAGQVHVGLDATQLEHLAKGQNIRKISSRDLAAAIVQKADGGTTVAATLVAAHAVGIRVFATGGIGGVHRQAPFDVSADLEQLARTPLVVVCAGAKAILDLPATLERLETLCVPVIGYQTDEFPAFYSSSSGLPVSVRANSAEEVAAIAHTQWELGMPQAVVVAIPPPKEAALPPKAVNEAIEQALNEAQSADVRGQAVTPFLLRRVSEITHGASLQANLALLLNNARLAAQIAVCLAKLR